LLCSNFPATAEADHRCFGPDLAGSTPRIQLFSLISAVFAARHKVWWWLRRVPAAAAIYEQIINPAMQAAATTRTGGVQMAYGRQQPRDEKARHDPAQSCFFQYIGLTRFGGATIDEAGRIALPRQIIVQPGAAPALVTTGK